MSIAIVSRSRRASLSLVATSRCRSLPHAPSGSVLGTLRWNTVVSTKDGQVIYEGPFAQLATRLKLVSVTSAGLGIFGIPLLIALNTSEIPPVGQLAVGGSAILAAVGSTVAMSFVFNPYVQTLERIPVRKCHSPEDTLRQEEPAGQEWLLKATTRNILSMKVETVFDPETDVEPYKGIRPFCNFRAKGMPMYIHEELLLDDKLRTQLFGNDEEPVQKDDDDGFL